MVHNDVYINVYDMTPRNKYTYPFGFGIFHSGIEVYGIEYAFGGHCMNSSGIYPMRPKVGVPGIKLRQSIHIGRTNLPSEEINILIRDFSQKYQGTSYNMIHRNCNHFSNDFSIAITGKGIPGWINRLAKIGSLVPCSITKNEEMGPSLQRNE